MIYAQMGTWETLGKIIIGILVVYIFLYLLSLVIGVIMFTRNFKKMKPIVISSAPAVVVAPAHPAEQPAPASNTANGFTNEFKK